MATVATPFVWDAKIISMVGVGYMLSHVYQLSLPPLFPLLKAEFDVSYAALGLAMSLFGFASGFGQTPVGFLVDRFGARPILVAGLVLQAGAVLLIGFASEYWQLVVLLTLAGFGHTVYHPADYAIMSASVDRTRLGRAYAIHAFSGNFGWDLTPAIMVGVTALWNWRTAFIAIGIVGLAYAIVIWIQSGLLDDDTELRRERAREDGPKDKESLGVIEGLKLLFSPALLMCFMFYLVASMGIGGIRNFSVAAFVEYRGMDLISVNSALTGLLLGSAIGILTGGVIADTVTRHKMIAALCLGSAAGLVVLMGYAELSLALLIVVMTAAGFLSGMVSPIRDMVVRAITPEGSAGKVFAFVSSGQNLAIGIVPVTFGWILDRTGPDWIFWLSAIFLMIALFTFIGLKAPPREPR